MKGHAPLQRWFHAVGLHVTRYPALDGLSPLVAMFSEYGVSTLVDVGANRGQYGRAIRRAGFAGPIVSYEPVAAAFEQLREAAGQDDDWTAHHCALGPQAGRGTIQVASNSAASSSFYAMDERHIAAAPDVHMVDQEEVEIRTLEDELHGKAGAFVKLDVQGYELDVLRGGGSLNSVVGLQIELSIVPLYVGSPDMVTVLGTVSELGFVTRWAKAGLTDRATGELLQWDVACFREQ